MSYISKIIEDLRKEYKEKQALKTSIELMYITRGIRKGSVDNEKLSL